MSAATRPEGASLTALRHSQQLPAPNRRTCCPRARTPATIARAAALRSGTAQSLDQSRQGRRQIRRGRSPQHADTFAQNCPRPQGRRSLHSSVVGQSVGSLNRAAQRTWWPGVCTQTHSDPVVLPQLDLKQLCLLMILSDASVRQMPLPAASACGMACRSPDIPTARAPTLTAKRRVVRRANAFARRSKR
jgi:hypothetical protein